MPALEMVVLHHGEEMPPASPWRMTLTIDPKRVAASLTQLATAAG